MPTLRYPTQKRPWLARAKREGLEYFLGYHKTREEAEAAEREFAAFFPPHPRGRRKIHNMEESNA